MSEPRLPHPDYCKSAIRVAAHAAVLFAVFYVTGAAKTLAQQAASSDIPPNAAAQIVKVTPDRAAAGSSAKIEIDGSNFSAGVYVSFSTPAVRVVSTERQDATKLTDNVEINPSAQPGAVTLYVSNPAGMAAQTSFTILPAAESPAAPATGAETTTTAAKPANAPEVSSVEPAKVTPGSQLTLKINGKGFADGAAVSFSNPGIQVLVTHFEKSSQLSVDIQVASDAATGSTSLFVVNPDDSEVESAFEVVAGAATTETPTTPTGPAITTPSTTTTGATTAKAQGGTAEQKFEVYNVGDAGTLLHNPTQAKGTLSLSGGKIHYEENGKEVFSAGAADIQEIAENVIFGINTGTFHVILKSSKTYNFASATLRPADTQAIVDSLRRAFQMN
jgi:hypothetical protein